MAVHGDPAGLFAVRGRIVCPFNRLAARHVLAIRRVVEEPSRKGLVPLADPLGQRPPFLLGLVNPPPGPAIHSASTRVQGYYDDRFDLVYTSAAWCTAIVLAVLGLVVRPRVY